MIGKTAKEISDEYDIDLVNNSYCSHCDAHSPVISQRAFKPGDCFSINDSDDDKVRKFVGELMINSDDPSD